VAYDVRAATGAQGTGTSFTVTQPAGAQATDGLYVAVIHEPAIIITVPGSWELLGSVFTADAILRVLRGYVAPTSGPWTFQLSATTKYAAAAILVTADTAVIGAGRPAPDVLATKLGVPPTTGPFVFPSVTPTNTGDVMLWIGGWGHHTTFTPPAGVTTRAQLPSGAIPSVNDLQLWVGSQAAATAAGVATPAISVANNNPEPAPAGSQAMISLALASVPPPASWVGDFETGDLTQYAWLLAADTDRVTVRTDTPRQGLRYARFTAQDDDVYPVTPTENPRAQVTTSRLLFPGMERWFTWSTRFPSSLPVVPPDGWLVFWQWHGYPYVGSPSVGFGVLGDVVNIERNQSYGYDEIWRAPLVRDAWQDFILRVNFAQDDTGFIELWLNGASQTFSNGRRRVYMRTIEPDQISGVELSATIYRKKGMFAVGTLDHDALRFDSAGPVTVQTLSAVRVFSAGRGFPVRATVAG
jgi:hypothetical protein